MGEGRAGVDPVPMYLQLSTHALIGCVLLPALLVATVTDLRSRRIPNRLTAGSALLLGCAWAVGDPSRLPTAAAWALTAGVPLAALALLVPVGMGMGDAKLAAVLGLALGPAVTGALLLGFLIAALAGVLVIARSGLAAGRRATLPLAPFLAAGGMLVWGLGGA